MSTLHITAGPFAFAARLEEAAAPKTCAAFRGENRGSPPSESGSRSC